MEETQKTNKKLYTIIIILVAIITLGAGIFIGKEINSNNKEPQQENNKPNNEKPGNNNNEVQPGIGDVQFLPDEGEKVKLNDEQIKHYMGLKETYDNRLYEYLYNAGVPTYNNIPNQELLYFLQLNIKSPTGIKETITVDEMKAMAKKYFPDKVKVKYEDIKFPGMDTVMYKLGNDNVYRFTNVGMGGAGMIIKKPFYVEGYYNVTKDHYVLIVKDMLIKYCSDTCSPEFTDVYGDTNFKNSMYHSNEWLDLNNQEHINRVYEATKDDMIPMQYTFKKNSSNNYVLTDVRTAYAI